MKSLIVIVAIAALSAVAGSIIVGMKSFDGTVTEDPYEDGLIWDSLQKKHAELGWDVQVREKEFVTGENILSVSATDRDGLPLAGATVEVMQSRPANAWNDRSSPAQEEQGGLFSARLEFPLYGNWEITVKVTRGNDALLFKKKIYVDKGGE